MTEGAEKYGRYNWLLLDTESILAHALNHILRYLEDPYKDTGEDDLVHASCRLMMAVVLTHPQHKMDGRSRYDTASVPYPGDSTREVCP